LVGTLTEFPRNHDSETSIGQTVTKHPLKAQTSNPIQLHPVGLGRRPGFYNMAMAKHLPETGGQTSI
jgi:hypothetical protein